jgi:purine-binding chemotaxis protein CheW
VVYKGQAIAWVGRDVVGEVNMATENSSGKSGVSNNEFLTFILGKEEYGIDILKVQEIRGYDAVTGIANMPEFIKGVINLRGIIVPIVDLRIKFKLPDITYDEFTVVVILNLGSRVMGIVVDSVSDVLTIQSEQIRPVPEMSAALDTRYILGLGTVDERMLILVDIEKLMLGSEMALVDEVQA